MTSTLQRAHDSMTDALCSVIMPCSSLHALMGINNRWSVCTDWHTSAGSCACLTNSGFRDGTQADVIDALIMVAGTHMPRWLCMLAAAMTVTAMSYTIPCTLCRLLADAILPIYTRLVKRGWVRFSDAWCWRAACISHTSYTYMVCACAGGLACVLWVCTCCTAACLCSWELCTHPAASAQRKRIMVCICFTYKAA